VQNNFGDCNQAILVLITIGLRYQITKRFPEMNVNGGSRNREVNILPTRQTAAGKSTENYRRFRYTLRNYVFTQCAGFG